MIEDLKRMAPHRGFSGYQPLIRAYVGQGLLEDLSAMQEHPEIARLIAGLRSQGVKDTALEKALEEAGVAKVGAK